MHAHTGGSAVCEIDQDAGQTLLTDELMFRLILPLLSYTLIFLSRLKHDTQPASFLSLKRLTCLAEVHISTLPP